MQIDKIDDIKKKLLQALEDHHGIVTNACKAVNVGRSTFYKWINEDEDFKKAVDEVQDVAIDFVESKLFQQIDEGNPTSTIFYLKTKAKKRGYIERQEIVHDGKLDNTIVEWRIHKDEPGDKG
jgi:hypothetical protein